MTDNNLTPEELQRAVDEAQKKSFVLIEFSETGAAEFTIRKNNVTPAQVLGAVAILELTVKNWWVQEENRRIEMENAQKLSVPTDRILRAK